jgi:hypothetical protein
MTIKMLDTRDPESPLTEINVLRLRVAVLDELTDVLEARLQREQAARLVAETRSDFLARELAMAMLLVPATKSRRKG